MVMMMTAVMVRMRMKLITMRMRVTHWVTDPVSVGQVPQPLL